MCPGEPQDGVGGRGLLQESAAAALALTLALRAFPGLDIDGLYRISGNLATIQKLRYKVDHGEAGPQHPPPPPHSRPPKR